MPRLRRSKIDEPGIRRVRRGRGFSYHWPDGTPVDDPDVLGRVRNLTIPPAWQDVWICPWPTGHIQATGIDAAGRRQYLYHPRWRELRDAEKHDRVLEVAARLPEARHVVERHLATRGLNRDRVLAAAFRLLDLGFFRIGSEEYAEDNGTFGLATVRRDHVHVRRGGVVTFDYPAKGGRQRVLSLADPQVAKVVKALLERADPSPRLLAYRVRHRPRGSDVREPDREWAEVRSEDINRYLREVVGGDISAKDFRTWHATVLAAVALAVSEGAEKSASTRKRAVSRAVREVADYLGNTPAVCRSSYIDQRLVDLFEAGTTIGAALPRLGQGNGGGLATAGFAEEAVIDLLGRPRQTTLLERS